MIHPASYTIQTIDPQDLLEAIDRAIAPLLDPKPEPEAAKQFITYSEFGMYSMAPAFIGFHIPQS